MAHQWTQDEIEEVAKLVGSGLPYRVVGSLFGVSSRAVSGVIFRLRKPLYDQQRLSPKHSRPNGGATRRRRKDGEIKPAKAPFAADDSCPDFAWDDEHCAAVKASAGGFPVMPRRAA